MSFGPKFSEILVEWIALRGFSLAWLLMFTKSFASLVCHIVGSFPSDKNDFLNIKIHEREKPPLARYKSPGNVTGSYNKGQQMN